MPARRLTPGRLVLASHNAGKLREVAALVAPYGMVVVAAGELGLAAPAETADSFLGNARIKALAAATASGLPTLADDSGFSVAAKWLRASATLSRASAILAGVDRPSSLPARLSTGGPESERSFEQ